ncbi:MAG: BCCT family transporter, partial [Gammaproteobacteria bacterium]
SAPKRAGAWFRVILVFSIASVTTVLLTVGGSAVVDTVQTGTIIGGFPFSIVILLMIINTIRRLKKRDSAIRELEKLVNNPDPNVKLHIDGEGEPRVRASHPSHPSPQADTFVPVVAAARAVS